MSVAVAAALVAVAGCGIAAETAPSITRDDTGSVRPGLLCPVTPQTATQIIGAPVDLRVLAGEHCAYLGAPGGALRFVDVAVLRAPSVTVQTMRQSATTAAPGMQLINRDDLGPGSFESVPADGSDASYTAEVSADAGRGSIAVRLLHNGYPPEELRRMLDQFATAAARS